MNDGETRIYRAGESWSEPPGATHSISRNASKTEPAKLLAVLVLDTDDNPLTTPIKMNLPTHSTAPGIEGLHRTRPASVAREGR